LLCNDSLFASFEVNKAPDRFDLLPILGNEKPDWAGDDGRSKVEVDKFVTDELAELFRNA
jgi:hypothetical protein